MFEFTQFKIRHYKILFSYLGEISTLLVLVLIERLFLCECALCVHLCFNIFTDHFN